MRKEGIDVFFGDAKPTKKKTDTHSKGWSEDWLKMRESNLLSLGQNKISKPYSQSYVVYTAIRAIAENLPQAVFKIYEGDEQVPITDPLQQLFNKPNPHMSRWELWESITTFLNLTGEAFIYLNESLGQRIGTNPVPAELWSLNPNYMEHTLVDGRVVGWVFNKQLPIKPEELIHIKLFSPYDPIRGLSPIAAIRSDMESDHSSARYNKVFFDNGANPDGVVEVDKDREITIEELKKLKRLWDQNHRGTNNSHKTAFLLGGMSYKTMGISQKDMEFLSGREFSRNAILSVFKVPPFVAGFNSKGEVNRSTAVASKAMFWTNTIKPQLRRIEEKLFADFFMPFAPGFVGKFDLAGIPELKPDLNDALEAGNKMFNLGYTRNEINERLELDMPVDPDGDVRYLPMNYIESGDSEDAQPAKSTEDVETKNEFEEITKELIGGVKKQRRQNHLKVQAKHERILHKKIKRHLFEVRSKTLEIIANSRPGRIVPKINDMLEDSNKKLEKLVTPVFRQIMTQGAKTALANLGIERTLQCIEHKQTEPLIDEAILLNRVNKIKGINHTLFNQLKISIDEAINENQTVQNIAEIITDKTRGVFNNASSRSIVIARTESNSLLNGSATETYKREGVQMKEWLTAGDEAVRTTHADQNGQVVPIESSFANGLQYPGDPGGPAEEVVNCRCAISPVIQ